MCFFSFQIEQKRFAVAITGWDKTKFKNWNGFLNCHGKSLQWLEFFSVQSSNGLNCTIIVLILSFCLFDDGARGGWNSTCRNLWHTFDFCFICVELVNTVCVQKKFYSEKFESIKYTKHHIHIHIHMRISVWLLFIFATRCGQAPNRTKYIVQFFCRCRLFLLSFFLLATLINVIR